VVDSGGRSFGGNLVRFCLEARAALLTDAILPASASLEPSTFSSVSFRLHINFIPDLFAVRAAQQCCKADASSATLFMAIIITIPNAAGLSS
jgi:hypothetical protein